MNEERRTIDFLYSVLSSVYVRQTEDKTLLQKVIDVCESQSCPCDYDKQKIKHSQKVIDGWIMNEVKDKIVITTNRR